jgi:hypothetical protein
VTRAWWAALVLSCATARPVAHKLTASDYPGVLTSPGSVPDFFRRQTITSRFNGRVQSFEAVLQKRGDTLTLVGLTPFGSKAFVLQQVGTEVRFTPILLRETPFPVEFILNDIQRTYFRGIPSSASMADGWHEEARDGELVRERWSSGHLQQRRFARLTGCPPGEVRIVFVSGAIPRIELDNEWFGYHLTITTTYESDGAPAVER